MKKQKDLIDFDKVAARALKKPEVMAAFTKARAMRLAAQAVRKAREREKLSQAEMAKAMGKPQSLVARIESARANTTVETLYEIAAATGTKLVISFRKTAQRTD